MILSEIIKKGFNKINMILQFPILQEKAKKTVKYIETVKNEDSGAVIVLLKGIGDTVYGMAYIDELLKKYGKVSVIGNINQRKLIESYSKGIQFIPYDVSKGEYKRYKDYMDCERYKKINTPFDLYNTDPYSVYDRKRHEESNSAISLLKNKIFKIESECDISFPPIIQNTDDLIGENIDLPSNSIILNPYSNSVCNVRKEVFEKIVQKLKTKGYIVYTNVTRNQSEIEGTKRLECSIEKLSLIACSVAGIVSIRSGILDLTINSGTPMFVIYSNCTSKFMQIYNLNAWKGKSQVLEVDYDSMDESNFYKEFDKWIDKYILK